VTRTWVLHEDRHQLLLHASHATTPLLQACCCKAPCSCHGRVGKAWSHTLVPSYTAQQHLPLRQHQVIHVLLLLLLLGLCQQQRLLVLHLLLLLGGLQACLLQLLLCGRLQLQLLLHLAQQVLQLLLLTHLLQLHTINGLP
jgi:hypothetical protein